jgi:Na+/H+-dicarboxylate symporter
MPERKASTLIFKIIFAILFGSLAGKFLTNYAVGVFTLRGLITVSDLLSQFISFFVPLVVLILVLPGIIELGQKASRLLLLAVIICYSSMVLAGFISFLAGITFIPNIFSGVLIEGKEMAQNLHTGFLPKILSPFLDVVGAIVLAFTFGLSCAYIKSQFILQFAKEAEKSVYLVLNKFLIPVLPFYIFCIFAKLSASGEFTSSIKSFAIIMLAIFIISNTLTVVLIFITSIICEKPFFKVLRSYMLSYFVALGTQSSKATIPVSLEAAKEFGTSKEIAEFAVPLLATIHLIGSMVTQIFGAMAIYYIFVGEMISPTLVISYIFLIATILLAAPGIPGGEPVATKPLLTSFLGFPPVVAEAMFTLGIANDSFATAVNVTGDSFVIMLLEKLNNKFFKTNLKQNDAQHL